MALQGDTVRLVVQFKTFEDVPFTPSNITLKIYNNAQRVVKEVTEDELIEEDIGYYFYDYIIPDDLLEYFIYEYRGEYKDKPILNRGKVKVRFK